MQDALSAWPALGVKSGLSNSIEESSKYYLHACMLRKYNAQCLPCMGGFLVGTRGATHHWTISDISVHTMQIPTIGFLYIAGWIGYVGRDYLIATKTESKPTQKEIIIDVPMALKMAVQVS